MATVRSDRHDVKDMDAYTVVKCTNDYCNSRWYTEKLESNHFHYFYRFSDISLGVS